MKNSSYISISIAKEQGSIEGYVINSNEVNVENYLKGFNVSLDLINKLKETYETIGILKNLYVEEDFRCQGVGSELFEEAIELAAINSADGIVVVPDILESNNFDLVDWSNRSYDFEIVGYGGEYPIMIKTIKNKNE